MQKLRKLDKKANPFHISLWISVTIVNILYSPGHGENTFSITGKLFSKLKYNDESCYMKEKFLSTLKSIFLEYITFNNLFEFFSYFSDLSFYGAIFPY